MGKKCNCLLSTYFFGKVCVAVEETFVSRKTHRNTVKSPKAFLNIFQSAPVVSLPGSFWAPGLIFCTLVSTGSDWKLWHVCWSLPASVVSNMCLTCGSGARFRPSWSFFKCFCCLSPAFVLGCFVLFFCRWGFCSLCFYWPPVPASCVFCSLQSSGCFNGMTAD